MCQVCALFVRLAICESIRSGRNWEMLRLLVNRLKFSWSELKTPFIARPAPSAEVCSWRDIWRPMVSKRPVALERRRLKSGWGFQLIWRRYRREKVEGDASCDVSSARNHSREKKKFERSGISHAIQLNSSIKEKESKDSQKTMPN